MVTKNITGSGTHTQAFEESLCSSVWVSEFKQQSISLSAVNILLSITAILGNSLIILFTRNLPSIRHPNSCIFVWQQQICWWVLLPSLSMLPIGCLWFTNTGVCQFSFYASGVTGYALCTVSMLTITTISVDRLLAMLLGLRYKEIVTLRCTYTKIFRTLSHHQARIQDYAQQQPSQPNALNMVRYRRAVYSALWVQLVLVVCYVPNITVEIVISLSLKGLSNFIVIRGMANVLVFFNSTLNPFLYCWKISEVRRAVKQTIRQAICYA